MQIKESGDLRKKREIIETEKGRVKGQRWEDWREREREREREKRWLTRQQGTCGLGNVAHAQQQRQRVENRDPAGRNHHLKHSLVCVCEWIGEINDSETYCIYSLLSAALKRIITGRCYCYLLFCSYAHKSLFSQKKPGLTRALIAALGPDGDVIAHIVHGEDQRHERRDAFDRVQHSAEYDRQRSGLRDLWGWV